MRHSSLFRLHPGCLPGARPCVRLVLAVLLLPVLCTGCGHKRYGAVQFESEPAGAEILNLKDDAILGLTPVLVTWESKSGEPEYVTVQMKKKGYLEQVASFWLNTRSASREAAAEEAQPVKLILKPRK